MMKTKIFSAVATLMVLGMTANAQIEIDPISQYITEQTDRLELEEELFGFLNNQPEAVSILSVDVFEVEEEIELDFNTTNYLPENFDPEKGKDKLDWNSIPLYEVEEEIEFDFESEANTQIEMGPGK